MLIQVFVDGHPLLVRKRKKEIKNNNFFFNLIQCFSSPQTFWNAQSDVCQQIPFLVQKQVFFNSNSFFKKQFPDCFVSYFLSGKFWNAQSGVCQQTTLVVQNKVFFFTFFFKFFSPEYFFEFSIKYRQQTPFLV